MFDLSNKWDNSASLDDWRFLLGRVERTKKTFSKLTDACETALKIMWLLEKEIMETAKKTGKMLSPSQTFVLSYSRRNAVYLQSSFILAAMAFSHPAISLQRTVYETILRGYLFVVDPTEASLYHSALRTDKEERFLREREYYGHTYLCKRLFKAGSIELHRRFYKELCVSAHAEIKGLLVGFPEYREKQVEDRLEIISSLSYGNLQMVTEMFLDSLDSALKKVIRNILKEIVISLGNKVPLFEPDSDVYASKVKLRKGNFMAVL